MKVIIAGSRTLGLDEVNLAMHNCNFKPTLIVSGHAKGVDKAGETWARQNNIPLKVFPANWLLGISAGYQRNITMAENADALVAVWDGVSKGTKHMINTALKYDLKVYIHKVK